jgi:phosphoribosyl 1,2-cyclic phosphate phosphodiesterase
MLRCGIKHLDALVFTHAHKDHLAGMDDVRGFNFRMKKPIRIFCDERVEKQMRNEFHYVFSAEKYPGIPDVEINRIDKSRFDIDDIPVQPIEVMHYKLPVLGFRFDDFV